MFQLKSTSRPIRRALLVGIQWGRDSREQAQSLLDELGELVDTLGFRVAEKLLVKSIQPQARLLLGSGKTEEIIALAREKKVDVIVFDHAISPAQQRNWETLSNIAVIDREEVILDIFVRRARTREARLQVELARMEYSLPRLTRAWQHLERQAGTGFGMTGAGETQLETDRRLVRRRIDRLKRELTGLRLQRSTRRKQRQRNAVPHVAIVGYTNAGKSSLFNALTGADALVEDRLFATLDTATRKAELPTGHPLLLTDTVGFVRKLPHGLIESFKATLEEAVTVDFLIHLLDVSNEAVLEFHKTPMDVLEELGADMQRMLTVFNKMDLRPNASRIASLRRQFPDAVFVSVHTGDGLDELRARLPGLVADPEERCDLLVPQSRYDLVSGLHRHGHVLSESYEGDNIRLTARLPATLLPLYADYRSTGKIVA